MAKLTTPSNTTEESTDSQAADASTTETSQQEPPFHILAVYLFVDPKLSTDELPSLKTSLESFCRQHNVRGSLLLAPEGINGTISYPPPPEEKEDAVLLFLQELFPKIRTRLSYSPTGHVFYRLKIKLKKEILTLRVTEDDNDSTTGTSLSQITTDPTRQKGIYVPPGEDWNALIQDPDCWVIDARNDYEIRLGTFQNAQDPKTTNFSELLPWMQQELQGRNQKPKKVAMFCTGGIRCEKASAACIDLAQDMNIPVYHLEGGILGYLDTVPQEKSLWDGSCYVFDQRVAVGHGLKAVAGVKMCFACRGPLRPDQQEGHPDFIQGRQCLYCRDKVTEQQQERFEARQRQIQLAEKKGLVHIHDPKEEHQLLFPKKKLKSQEPQQQQQLSQQNVNSGEK